MSVNKVFKLVLPALLGLMVIFAVGVKAQSQEVTIKPGESWSGSVPKSATLSLEGRIEYSKPAGANYIMEVNVNGKALTSALTNKGSSFRYEDGRVYDYRSGNAWILFYSPDFSSNDSSAGGVYQVMTDPGQAYRYSWDISSLAGSGPTMDLVIKNNSPTYTIVGRLTAGAGGKKFPIAELGGCGSQSACNAYCEKKENIQSCVNYAESNGMISPEEADQARKFADALAGGTPGSCKDRQSCESYCADVSHIEECVAFAEKYNFTGKGDLAQAKKIAQALKNGQKMPGGCTSKESCDSYCQNVDHADECISFGEATGVIPQEELVQAKKVLPFMKAGKSPGGCKSKAECESYCEADSHFEECIGFAEQVGFVNKEEADMARKSGGKGPGGCKSKQACEDYCNKTENAQACFNFAKEKGILPPEKLKEIEDGMGRLRTGLSQMPPEMVSCLKESMGQDVVDKIQSGSLVPGPKIGELVKGCVQKSLPALKAKMSSAMKMATPEVKACLEQGGVNDAELEKIQNGEAPKPELGDVMKKCFETLKKEGMDKARAGLAKMPPQMRQCIEEKLGAETVRKIQAGEDVEADASMGDAFESCAKNVSAQMQGQVADKMNQAPPEVKKCIEEKLGGSVEDAIKNGKISGPEAIQGIVGQCMAGMKIPQGVPGGPSGMPQGSVPGGSGSEIPMGPPPGTQMGPPSNIPSGGGPVAAPGGQGGPDMGQLCPQFQMAPSCDYVPESARDICKKCKGQ